MSATRLLAVLGAGAVALVLGASAARAQSVDARCDVYEIQASNGTGGIDPALGPLTKKLQKAPFTGWTEFKLLRKHEQDVELKKPVSLSLTTSGKMSLLLRDKVVSQNKVTRLRLTVTMLDSNGKQTLETTTQVDSGDAWLIGGEAMPGNAGATYFVGIACTAKP